MIRTLKTNIGKNHLLTETEGYGRLLCRAATKVIEYLQHKRDNSTGCAFRTSLQDRKDTTI